MNDAEYIERARQNIIMGDGRRQIASLVERLISLEAEVARLQDELRATENALTMIRNRNNDEINSLRRELADAREAAHYCFMSAASDGVPMAYERQRWPWLIEEAASKGAKP